MKKNTYTLNTLLAMVLGATLLAAVLVRTFAPRIIIAELDIPNMVLISLVTLVLDHYLAPDAKRCYICIPVFSAITFRQGSAHCQRLWPVSCYPGSDGYDSVIM